MVDDVQIKVGATATDVKPGADEAVEQIKRIAGATQQAGTDASGYTQAWEAHNNSFFNAWKAGTDKFLADSTKIAKGYQLNRGQIQEFVGVARHSFDQIAAGGSIFTTFTTHAATLAQALGSGEGGITGGLAGIAGMVGPAVVGLGGLLAIAGTLIGTFLNFEHELGETRVLLSGVGEYSGLTVSEFERMAHAASDAGTISTQGARDIQRALLSTGQVATDVLPKVDGMADDFAATMGITTVDAAKRLATALEDPYAGFTKLNTVLHFADDATMQLIKTQQEQGNMSGAQATALDALAAHIRGATERTDIWSQSWHNLSKAATQSLDDIGRAIAYVVSFAAGNPLMRGEGGTSSFMAKARADADAARQASIVAGDAYRALMPQQQQIETIQGRIKVLQAAILTDTKNRAQYTAAIAQGERQIHDLQYRQSRVGSAGEHKPKKTAGPSIMSEYQAELDKQLAADRTRARDGAQVEANFWAQKLTLVRAGSKEAVAIQDKIAVAQRKVSDQELDRAAKAYATWSGNHLKIQLDAIQTEEANAQGSAQTKLGLAQEEANQEMILIDQRERRGEISGTTAVAQRNAVNERMRQAQQQEAEDEYQIELKALQDRLALYPLDEDERARINGKIEQLERNHQNQMLLIAAQARTQKEKDDDAALQEAERKYGATVRSLVGTWSQGIQGMVRGTMSFRQVWASFGEAIMSQFMGWVEKQVSTWIIGQLAQTGATATGVATRNTMEAAGAAQGIAINGLAAIAKIAQHAAVAAAGAYAAIASIPYIGPFLAPVMAGVALAAVLALGKSIFSAEGGFGEVPAGGAMTQLHPKEMVLPSGLATPLRRALTSPEGPGSLGGGAGPAVHHHTWNVSAVDAKSFARMLRGPEGQAMVDELVARVRAGALVGRQLT